MKRESVNTKQACIAALSIGMIATHLVLRFGVGVSEFSANLPLLMTLSLGGIPLVLGLAAKMIRRQFGSDLLAGISIVTSILLGEYLAGSLVVLMLSGGEALEGYAVGSASSVLRALAKRMPTTAHLKVESVLQDVGLAEIKIGDELLVFPHEICPVDGTVLAGHGTMDESYLTGEPFMMSKTPGVQVISGAVNGDSALTVRADRLAADSRYSKIMQVMQSSEQRRPRLRRLGDRLGAWYTPIAVLLGVAAWAASGDPVRFLAVMVVATPCPLLIGIPVAIIGAISLAAKRAIIVRDPVSLEMADACTTIIFDKTGTLTYGKPKLSEQFCAAGFEPAEVLSLTASLEQYSKHPLSEAVLAAGRESRTILHQASEVRERPGEGLHGTVAGRQLQITSRKKLSEEMPDAALHLPPHSSGLECVILIDNSYAATYTFRDEPRVEGPSFVNHLGPRHHMNTIMLLSGDRESEVQYLARRVGIPLVHAGKSPEQKLDIVRAETAKANTVFVGDGINDAPALMAATIGVAFGINSDVTTEAAGVVIMDSSLEKVDEFLHISRRMRRIALQSAIGGMALSIVGMVAAAFGYLPPVAGAIAQEVIDVVAVVNALRVAVPPKSLTDFD